VYAHPWTVPWTLEAHHSMSCGIVVQPTLDEVARILTCVAMTAVVDAVG